MRIFILILSLIILQTPLAFAQSEQAKSPQKILISSFPFPPLLHEAEDGSFSGTLGETVKYICERAAFDCEFKVEPLKRSYANLRVGKVDALITLDLGQFNECCLPSRWISPWSAGFFSKGPVDNIPDVPKDLVGRSFIVVNGMRSPYSFMPRMDDLAETGVIELFRAQNIKSAVQMFVRDRSPLLWGGEEFKWYINKLDPDMGYTYKSLFTKNVVLWVRNDHKEFLKEFNKAFDLVRKEELLTSDGKLVPVLMNQRYKDAPME